MKRTVGHDVGTYILGHFVDLGYLNIVKVNEAELNEKWIVTKEDYYCGCDSVQSCYHILKEQMIVIDAVNPYEKSFRYRCLCITLNEEGRQLHV